MFKLLWDILKDKQGFEAGGALGGAASGATLGSTFGPVGTVLGAIGGGLLGGFGKKKKKEEIYDPYASQRQQYLQYMSGKLGQSTPYAYNPAFEIPQPGIESQAESVISGRLGQLPKAEDYKARVETAKTQAIARERESASKQKEEEANMYNRLGLVSSTPWMTRAGELGEEALMREADITSDYDIYGLDYGLKADALAEDIANQYLSQAGTLGRTQRAGSEYATTKSLEDLVRQIEEEESYSRQLAALLGYNPPERTVSYTPNTAMQLLGVLQNPQTGGALNTIKDLIFKA